MGWPVVALGEVAKQVQRPEAPQPGTPYRQIGVRLWGQGAYQRETVDGSETKYPIFYRVEKDDVIVNKIWARNGSVAVVAAELAGSFGSAEFLTYEVDRAILLPGWFAWFTKTPELWEQCDSLSRGTSGQNRLRPERFLDVRLPLPALDEQQRIVTKLNKVAALVEEVQRLRQEIGQEMLAVVQSTHFELADVAERPFGEFIELWEERVPIDPTARYPQIGLRGFAGGLFFKDAIQGSETKYKTFNRLSKGLLVVSQPKGWEGAVAVCDASHEGWCASPEYRTFRCKPGLLNEEYLAALLPTPWFQRALTKLTRGQGARRERIRPEMLLDMKVQMPIIEVQRAALRSFWKLRALDSAYVGAEEDLEDLLPAMLHGVFGGKGFSTLSAANHSP